MSNTGRTHPLSHQIKHHSNVNSTFGDALHDYEIPPIARRSPATARSSPQPTRFGPPLGTLERWRWTGEGPRYIKLVGRIVYRLEDVEVFENARLHESTSRPVPAVAALPLAEVEP